MKQLVNIGYMKLLHDINIEGGFNQEGLLGGGVCWASIWRKLSMQNNGEMAGNWLFQVQEIKKSLGGGRDNGGGWVKDTYVFF